MKLIPHMWASSHQQYTILEMSESEIFGVRKPIKAILLSQDKRNVPMEFRTLHADTCEHETTQSVLNYLQKALIDLHNVKITILFHST